MTMRLFSCNLPIVTGSSTGLEKKSDMMDFLVDEMKSLQSTQPGASIDRLGPDCLGVGEFAQAEMRQLPAIAVFLDAAHRNTRVRCRKTVDKYATGFQATGNALGAGDIVGPQTAAQAVVTGIGQ